MMPRFRPCPICHAEFEPVVSDGPAPLSTALGAVGGMKVVGSRNLLQREQDIRDHMETHSIEEWL